MALLTALYDACVLYPAPLRDLLMQLALTDRFRAKWTEAIHAEWINAVLRERPDLTRPQLERTRDLMNRHARDCLIEGYEALIPSLTLPDPNDRHVLAAAIHGRADIIVTFNLKDFPDWVLKSHGVKAQHPDEFLKNLCGSAPADVCESARKTRARLKNPPKSVDEYLEILALQKLPETVAFLRENRGLL
jgi:predicted nucleic acid-binding protein